MRSLTSFCKSPHAESSDALLTDCVCSAPDVIPVFDVREGVAVQHADLNVTCTYADQLARKNI